MTNGRLSRNQKVLAHIWDKCYSNRGVQRWFWRKNKEIGNYFETKEEAEKAVEKLKAWKRLKDKGFKFCGIDGDCIRFSIDISKVNSTKEKEELNKYGESLFGGEE